MPKLSEILGDSFNQIPEDLRKKYENVDLVDSSNYVEKRQYDTAQTTIKQYEKDIQKRDKDLEDLREKAKDNEELTKKIDDLKIENKKTTDNYKVELEKINFEYRLEKKLGDYNPHNVDILKKALDLTKIKADGDNFIGLEEQIKSLNETDKYLFKETTQTEKPKGTGVIIGSNSSADDKGPSGIGAILAKTKTENANAEAQNKFFA
ncbi:MULTISPECIES: phage scaffolding protein [Clostridium]|uniref:Phage scaffolding protein n=1 Tax=Candidatus Clostridium helianthi TaxID=3381660 RepID=A0ABW8S449_9CLOT|nr:phage scaffolding protein [Clostridium beijerinckii]ALB46222.1 phage scaffold protein [Clostridium beijerinckii NRRL B-598]